MCIAGVCCWFVVLVLAGGCGAGGMVPGVYWNIASDECGVSNVCGIMQTLVYLALVSGLCAVGSCVVASGNGGGGSDVCGCDSAMGECGGSISEWTCHNVISLWAQTYNSSLQPC